MGNVSASVGGRSVGIHTSDPIDIDDSAILMLFLDGRPVSVIVFTAFIVAAAAFIVVGAACCRSGLSIECILGYRILGWASHEVRWIPLSLDGFIWDRDQNAFGYSLFHFQKCNQS